MQQPMLENYIHSRIASTELDALDRTIFEVTLKLSRSIVHPPTALRRAGQLKDPNNTLALAWYQDAFAHKLNLIPNP